MSIRYPTIFGDRSDGKSADYAWQIADLLHRARLVGYVITVDLVPQDPLRMGAYDQAVHVRPVRMLVNCSDCGSKHHSRHNYGCMFSELDI